MRQHKLNCVRISLSIMFISYESHKCIIEMMKIVTQNLWDVLITLNMKYRVVINGRVIHIYDLIGLWSYCWEYYIDDAIIMLIDECLELHVLVDFLIMIWDMVEMILFYDWSWPYVEVVRFTFMFIFMYYGHLSLWCCIYVAWCFILVCCI